MQEEQAEAAESPRPVQRKESRGTRGSSQEVPRGEPGAAGNPRDPNDPAAGVQFDLLGAKETPYVLFPYTLTANDTGRAQMADVPGCVKLPASLLEPVFGKFWRREGSAAGSAAEGEADGSSALGQYEESFHSRSDALRHQTANPGRDPKAQQAFAG